MSVALAGGHRSRRVEQDRGRPQLYLVPPLSEFDEVADCEFADYDDPDRAYAAFDAPTAHRPVSQRAVRARARRHSVRLTLRGRVVVVFLLLGLMVGVAALLASASQAATPSSPARTLTVEPGDTLWSISVSALPDEDPYEAVAKVRRLNHMRDDTVFVGQQLTLPPSQ